MKGKLILLIIIIGAIYYFYWNIDTNAVFKKIDAIDKKYLNGILPMESKLEEYKIALLAVMKELSKKGPSAEKQAIEALIEMKLKTTNIIVLQKRIDMGYKKLNSNAIDCQSPEFMEVIEAYDELDKEISSIIKLTNAYEKQFTEFYKKLPYIKNLKESMLAISEGFKHQKIMLEEGC